MKCARGERAGLDAKSYHELRRNGVVIELTTKEFSLLHYFITNPNQRLSRQDLLREV